MRKEIKIGIFALAAIFALYWGINFLKGKDLFRLNRTYYAYYTNVSGIQITSPVIIKGISIGSVTEIEFRPDMDNVVQVKLSVKSGYDIPANSVARIASTGIIGGKAIELDLGDSDIILEDGAAIRSQDEQGIFGSEGFDMDMITKKLTSILTSLDSTLKNIDRVLGDNGQTIDSTLAHIESVSASIDRTVSSKADSLALIIDNLTAFSDMLADNSAHIGGIMANIDEFSASLAEVDIAATATKLNEAADGINEAVTTLNSGEGSLGLLLRDKALYESLSQASANLATLLADLEANPNRYVHFSLFGRKNK